MAGEFDFIDWVRRQQAGSDFVVVPPGDDLAVLKWPADQLLLVGVDQVLEGVHFDRGLHDLRSIGRKVMNRNLSDCAAMACLPAAAVATVAAPRDLTLTGLQELFLGMRGAADPFGCPVVGGDTGAWDGPLVLTVSILGRSNGTSPIRRSGAKSGDTIFVSGPLGGSILGRHITFSPRVELARALAATSRVSAMLDLSDGLSRDLPHICQASGVGARINAAAIPIHADALALAGRDGRAPLEHALHDGEDYELLLTANAASLPGCWAIGTIQAGATIELVHADGRTEPLVPRGWEHHFKT